MTGGESANRIRRDEPGDGGTWIRGSVDRLPSLAGSRGGRRLHSRVQFFYGGKEPFPPGHGVAFDSRYPNFRVISTQ